MCKFNNRLFNFAGIVFAVIHISLALPVNRKLSKNSFSDYYDYDQDLEINFDQRQNGSENYRVNFKGVIITLPSGVATNNLELLSFLGISESDLLSLMANLDGEPTADTEQPQILNESPGENSEDLFLLKPDEASDNSSAGDTSGKSFNGQKSETEVAGKPHKPHKMKLHFANFLKLLRRRLN